MPVFAYHFGCRKVVSQQSGLCFSVRQLRLAHFLFLQKEGTTMKKAISLILALVLCLSLCACGADQKPAGAVPSGTVPTGTTGVTTSPTGASTSPVTSTTIPGGDSTSGSHISDHPWMEDLYGTWEYDSEFSGYLRKAQVVFMIERHHFILVLSQKRTVEVIKHTRIFN